MRVRAYLNVDWPRALDGYTQGDSLVLAFAGEVTPRMSPQATCEFVWALLNRDDRPNGKLARAMCVGDVAVLGGETAAEGSWWVVTSTGWRQIEPAPSDVIEHDDERTKHHLAENARLGVTTLVPVDWREDPEGTIGESL